MPRCSRASSSRSRATATSRSEPEPSSPKTVEEATKRSARPRATRFAPSGGLHIVGTERHESRRIDNQLRGRAGRQGDPGSSRFYLSLEDDLMRIFAGDKVKTLMERHGHARRRADRASVGHVNRSATRSRRSKARNFDIRKNLLEYDDVMSEQRKTVYTIRQQLLLGHLHARAPRRRRQADRQAPRHQARSNPRIENEVKDSSARPHGAFTMATPHGRRDDEDCPRPAR